MIFKIIFKSCFPLPRKHTASRRWLSSGLLRRTWNLTYRITVTKVSLFDCFRETIAVCSESRSKSVNSFCGYSYWTLRQVVRIVTTVLWRVHRPKAMGRREVKRFVVPFSCFALKFTSIAYRKECLCFACSQAECVVPVPRVSCCAPNPVVMEETRYRKTCALPLTSSNCHGGPRKNSSWQTCSATVSVMYQYQKQTRTCTHCNNPGAFAAIWPCSTNTTAAACTTHVSRLIGFPKHSPPGFQWLRNITSQSDVALASYL
jgi:hypothetical protein